MVIQWLEAEIIQKRPHLQIWRSRLAVIWGLSEALARTPTCGPSQWSPCVDSLGFPYGMVAGFQDSKAEACFYDLALEATERPFGHALLVRTVTKGREYRQPPTPGRRVRVTSAQEVSWPSLGNTVCPVHMVREPLRGTWARDLLRWFQAAAALSPGAHSAQSPSWTQLRLLLRLSPCSILDLLPELTLGPLPRRRESLSFFLTNNEGNKSKHPPTHPHIGPMTPAFAGRLAKQMGKC